MLLDLTKNESGMTIRKTLILRTASEVSFANDVSASSRKGRQDLGRITGLAMQERAKYVRGK